MKVEPEKLEHQLKSNGIEADAAEAHGELCGRACLAGAAAIRPWQQALMEEVDPDDVLAQECNRSLETLAADTLLKLEAGDLGFEPLLPDDEQPLRQRTAALADWCHGFMQGLVIGGGGDQGSVSDLLGETLPSEILDDFSEITKAGFLTDDAGEESEEAEQAYAELVEYVRVSAQLIYDETVALRNSPPANQLEH